MANEVANKTYVSELRLAYYDSKLKTWVQAKDADILAAAKAYAKEYADGLADNYEAAGSVATAQQALQANIDTEKQRAEGAESGLSDRIGVVEGDIGTMENLDTTAKDDLVSAINEVRNAVSAGGTAAAITMKTDVTTDGALKTYTLYQGENKVGAIDIPKDMVVESGEVVVDPEGQAAGTYIKLVLANVKAPLYINVATLVDIYKAKADATQVQIAVDSTTREISAVIVAGSVGTTELADGAVTTAKIADGNVTKAKLSTAVQGSLDKADAAAPQTALDAEAERAAAAEAQVLVDAKAYADSKVAGVDLTGIASNTEAINNLSQTHATDKAALEAKDKTNSDAIAAIQADYLKAEDKTALQGNIDTLSQTHATDKAALEASIAAVDASLVEISEATIDGWFTE